MRNTKTKDLKLVSWITNKLRIGHTWCWQIITCSYKWDAQNESWIVIMLIYWISEIQIGKKPGFKILKMNCS